MRLMTTAFADGQRITGDFALCVPDAAAHVRLSANINPDIAWSDLPPDTQSLALPCPAPHGPSPGDDVHQEGRPLPTPVAPLDVVRCIVLAPPAHPLPLSRAPPPPSAALRPAPSVKFAACEPLQSTRFSPHPTRLIP